MKTGAVWTNMYLFSAAWDLSLPINKILKKSSECFSLVRVVGHTKSRPSCSATSCSTLPEYTTIAKKKKKKSEAQWLTQWSHLKNIWKVSRSISTDLLFHTRHLLFSSSLGCKLSVTTYMWAVVYTGTVTFLRGLSGVCTRCGGLYFVQRGAPPGQANCFNQGEGNAATHSLLVFFPLFYYFVSN